MQKCVVCGSDNIQPWLGGAIGTLYHCTDCHYIGPVILKDVETTPESRLSVPKSIFRAGNFWSETGIGNQSLFET